MRGGELKSKLCFCCLLLPLIALFVWSLWYDELWAAKRSALSHVGGRSAFVESRHICLSVDPCIFSEQKRLHSCLFNDIWVHNNSWWFVSDQASLLDEPTFVDTLLSSPRGYKDVEGPVSFRKTFRKISIQEWKKLHHTADAPVGLINYKADHLHIYLTPLFPKRFGHVYVDAVMPAFHTMRKFLLYTSNTQIVVSNATEVKVYPEWSKIWRTITTREVLSDQDMFDQCPQGSWCLYKQVLVGTACTGWFHDAGSAKERAKIHDEYRVFGLRNLGMSDIETPPPGKPPLRIVFIQRLKGALMTRSVVNMHQLVELTRTRYANLCHVSLHYFEEETIENQIRLFMSASIVVGVDGTAFENVFWSQAGTHLILLSRTPAGVPEEKFNHFGHSSYSGVYGVPDSGPHVRTYIADYIETWRLRNITTHFLFTHRESTENDSMSVDPEEFLIVLEHVIQLMGHPPPPFQLG